MKKLSIILILVISTGIAEAKSSSSYSVKRSTAGECGTAMGQGIAEGIRRQQELEYQKQLIQYQYQLQIQYERELQRLREREEFRQEMNQLNR